MKNKNSFRAVFGSVAEEEMHNYLRESSGWATTKGDQTLCGNTRRLGSLVFMYSGDGSVIAVVLLSLLLGC